MTIEEAMAHRHSIRYFIDKPIAGEDRAKLLACIDEQNAASGLSIRMMFDEPKAFDGQKGFLFCKNYLVMAGKKSPEDKRGRKLDETVGYYGEKIVLYAETIGLGTCWVKMTYKKQPELYGLAPDEDIVCVIAIGYPAFPGEPHRNRLVDDVIRAEKGMPQWYIDGARASLLAPTAMNQQMYYFVWKGGNKCQAKPNMPIWPCIYIDLGIVKYHFELGAGPENFEWADK